MKVWPDNPAAELERVFGEIGRTRMAGLPICNPLLAIEAVAFRQQADGHWVGVMITPWAINLLVLPGSVAGWPVLAAGETHHWRFASGDYAFIVAEEAELGRYHLCSLFSPAGDFPSHAAARELAEAIGAALDAAPIAPPAAPSLPTRRAFLGLGR